MNSLLAKTLVVGGILASMVWMWLLAINPGRIYAAHYAGIVTVRPEEPYRTIHIQRPFWHRIDLSLDHKAITTSRTMQSTFYVDVTDCSKRDIYPGHVFVNSVSIFQVYKLDESKYNNLLKQNAGRRVSASIYLADEEFKRFSRLCVQAGGGAMFGYGFKGNTAEVSGIG